MSKYGIEIKWAFIFIATLLIWSLLEMLLGFHGELIEHHPVVSMLFMIPAILIFVFALKEKKKKFYHGEISFKQTFLSGLLISIIIAIFNPGVQWIISYVISPDYFENAIKLTVESGNDTLENAKEFFTYESYVIQGIIWAIVSGILTSAIVGLIIKSKKKS